MPLDYSETQQILTRIESDLTSVLAPELHSARAQLLAGMMAGLLRTISAELKNATADAAIDSARQRAAQTLASVSSQGMPHTISSQWLTTTAGQLMTKASSTGNESQAVLRTLIECFEVEETARAGGSLPSRDAAYAESGSGKTARSGAADAARPISTDQVNAYISQRLAGAAGAVAHEVQAVASGFSKDTFIVKLRDPKGPRGDWVLRRDLRFSPSRSSVTQEFPLLRALPSHDLLAPVPIWLECEPEWFGTPVMAMERLPGNSDSSQWTSDPQRARVIGMQAARLLAKVHAVDHTRLPARDTKVPGTQGNSPTELIAHMRAFWSELHVEPNPLMEAVLVWLERNAPRAIDRPVLVHSDFGFHNLLVEGDRIQGLLDWEFTHIGDAHEDLASARQFFEKVVPWQDFVREYEAAGGVRRQPELEHYYGVVLILRIVLGLYRILDGLRNADPGVDSKLAYVGRSYAASYLLDAARKAAAPLS